jgi:hypothetical protein
MLSTSPLTRLENDGTAPGCFSMNLRMSIAIAGTITAAVCGDLMSTPIKLSPQQQEDDDAVHDDLRDIA